MKYMLLMYAAQGAWPDDEHRAAIEESIDLCHELNAQCQYISASPLHPVSTATTVRVRDGKAIVMDGPFAETNEQLGGYFLIDAANLDEAIAIAAKIPGSRKGTAEIRPVVELPELPISKTAPDSISSTSKDLASENESFQYESEGVKKKYMLLVYSAEDAWTEEERQDCMEASTDLCHDLNAKGQFLAASPLFPVAMATSIRVRDGKRLITDGPFAETTEQLGGYYIIEVENREEAVSIAARIPASQKGTVEIRPIVELARLPVPQAWSFRTRLQTSSPLG